MSTTAGLHVAIHENDSGVYKHWSLFIDGPTDTEKIELNIKGSSTSYYFEMMESSNARESASLLELIHLYDADASTIGVIKDAGRNATIHNEYPGYNCQDYVLELLDELEAKGIIDGKDAKYRKNRKIVESKQEGLA